ncbi:GDNF family receptor alpha-3 isoform X2 [Syngnathoides biaculeatus]|uniref:GDNF family receptor alpha-3 isoform X2 n=1 Tax=Syngnathoides biaculeatus TaxID=300417 RepID=UPI002ADE0582|nr:GDNF family receptor alpha-3 isoform X2 [Syngnathoides biaculeatus]
MECRYHSTRPCGFARHSISEKSRSRLADFIQNCEPLPLTTSGCLRDSAGLCLQAYAGLVGTIMTPNYIDNDSAAVSLSCNCKGSSNQWQECLKLQQMISHNTCLPVSNKWRFPLRRILCHNVVFKLHNAEVHRSHGGILSWPCQFLSWPYRSPMRHAPAGISGGAHLRLVSSNHVPVI